MRNPRVVMFLFGVSGNVEGSVLYVIKPGAYGNAEKAANGRG